MLIGFKRGILLVIVLLFSIPIVFAPGPELVTGGGGDLATCATDCFWTNGTARTNAGVQVYVKTDVFVNAVCNCIVSGKNLVTSGNAIISFYNIDNILISQASVPINSTGDAKVSLPFRIENNYYFNADSDPAPAVIPPPPFSYSSGTKVNQLLYVTNAGPAPPAEDVVTPAPPPTCGNVADGWGCSADFGKCERLNLDTGLYEDVRCFVDNLYCGLNDPRGDVASCYVKKAIGELCVRDIECEAGDCIDGICSVPAPVDEDGDGYTDAEEEAAGTDPSDPDSFPRDVDDATATSTDTDEDGIPNVADTDIDGDGLSNDVDTDDDGDGLDDGVDADPDGDGRAGPGGGGRTRITCSSVGGMICPQDCGPGSALRGNTVDFPCCVPGICSETIPTPQGVFVTITDCKDVDGDSIDDRVEYTCPEEFADDCENNLISEDQVVIAGVEAPFRVTGNCFEVQSNDAASGPFIGIGSLVIAFAFLFVFYFHRSRKVLKRRR